MLRLEEYLGGYVCGGSEAGIRRGGGCVRILGAWLRYD